MLVLKKLFVIDVKVETEDSKATYEIKGNDKLTVGENLITITVTAENENIREYKIKVVKKEKSETLSNNSKLSSLIVDGYSINFNSSKYEYTIKINKEEQLSIHYKAEDEGSVVTISGNEKLQNGSIITIKVTAEDGTETEYKIIIAKSESNILLFVIIGAIVLVIIMVVVIILNKKKPNSSNNETLTENNTNNVDEIPVIQNIQPQISPAPTTPIQGPTAQVSQPEQTLNVVQNAPFFATQSQQSVQNTPQQVVPTTNPVQQTTQVIQPEQQIQNNQNFTI